MGHTIIEKIIRNNIGKDVKAGEIVTVNVDRVMIHDIFIPFVASKFEEMGFKKLWDADKVVLIYDHLVPASQVDDTRHFKIGNEFVKKYGMKNNVNFNVEEFYNGIDFLETYKGNYDFIIMDIEMPQLNGIEICEELRKNDPFVPVIIISHSSQYAVKGYSVNAYGYVLKPIEEFDFHFLIDKVLAYIKEKEKNYIVLSTKTMMKKIDINDIYYLEVSSHVLRFKTRNDDIQIRAKIKDYEEKLLKYGFVRCDNSYLVNLKYCSNVNISESTINIYGEIITISRPKKKTFLEALTKYIGDNI